MPQRAACAALEPSPRTELTAIREASCRLSEERTKRKETATRGKGETVFKKRSGHGGAVNLHYKQLPGEGGETLQVAEDGEFKINKQYQHKTQI